MLGISTSNLRVGGFRGKSNDADAVAINSRIIADGGVSNLSRLNYFVKGLKAIYGDLANVPVCYDAHWIGYKLGSGTGPTLGRAAAKLYSLTVAGDAVQATAASQPLLLAHSGVNYAWFPGVSTNYINSTTTYATNNIDIEFSINQRSGTTLNNQQVIGTNTTIPIAININRGIGTIAFEYYVGGFQSCSAPFTWAETNVIRVTRNSTTGVVTFINNGITLTTSGTQIAGAFDSAITSLCVGGYTSGYPFEGKINYVKCYIVGVLTRYFNPAEYSASISQTQWTSTTGEVWTINTGTAATGYKGVLVDRTIVMYDKTDDNLLAPNNALLNTVLGTDHCSVLVAIRFTTTNNEFLMQVGGDYTDNNSTQWSLGGALLNLTRTNKGITLANSNTTNNYVLAKAFSYADSIIFGGTSIQLINASSNSGSYYNNTTNKPIPNTGLLLAKSAGIGNFNGILSTIIIGNDPTKYILTKDFARSLNNNFAL
jgi:hypothetical protein